MSTARTFWIRTLQQLARLVLARHSAQVVAVTGSYGKTTAKEAIAHVLGLAPVQVRTSPKSYNNEIGLPLGILGVNAPGRSLAAASMIIIRGLAQLRRRAPFPDALILEMGADHPGDLKKLTAIAPPRVSVVTAVGPVHTEFYHDGIEGVAREKQTIIEILPENGLAVLNADDVRVRRMASVSKAPVRTYGRSSDADVRATDVSVRWSRSIPYLSCTVRLGDQFGTLNAYATLSDAVLISSLASVAVGHYFNLSLPAMLAQLETFKPPPGRMNPIPGIKQSLLIDDSYNASPDTMRSAIRVLASVFGERRRWAVLGDMGELGKYSQEGHAQVGREVAERGIEYLVTVGERSRDAARAALLAGMSDDCVFTFGNTHEAGMFIQNRLRAHDVVMIKGSQNASRMERIVKELMAEPARAKDLLVRQGDEWKKQNAP